MRSPRYRISLIVLAGLAAATVARAHEKWFVTEKPPALQGNGFFSAFALSAAVVAGGITLAMGGN